MVCQIEYLGFDVKIKTTITNFHSQSSDAAVLSLLTCTIVGFLSYCIWTQWRFRFILSGLQRVQGNTNETFLAAWPIITDGSHHRALSYNVDMSHLGARLDSR